MRPADSLRHARRAPDWRWRRDLTAWLGRPAWPRGAASGDRVAVVCANYNTRELVCQLIFSLHRVLPRGAAGPIVIVDNASTDGSREALGELHDAGLIRLLANDHQRFHGPALNQGIAWLAEHDPVDYVWVLDSDVVVLRGEVVADAVAAMRSTRAALLGEHDGPKVALNSVLLDPAIAWRRAYPPFLDHGDPSIALQRALGPKVRTFPFRHGTYVLHLGRGTLSEVAAARERDHPQFDWAVEHRERTYGSHPFGERLHRAFLERYDAELEGRTLAEACATDERIVLPQARPLPPLDEVARRYAEGTLDELYDQNKA